MSQPRSSPAFSPQTTGKRSQLSSCRCPEGQEEKENQEKSQRGKTHCGKGDVRRRVATLLAARVGSTSPARLLTNERGCSRAGIRLSQPARCHSGDGGRANVCRRNSSP